VFKEGVEVWVEVCAEREGKEGWVEGGCGFSSLMKQKIEGKNCAVFCFAGKRLFFIYEVITWGKNLERPSNYYLCAVAGC